MPFPTSVQHNPVVQQAVRRLDELGDPRFGQTLLRCLDDTLARTIRPMPDGTAFVVTGDIPAMWLRDSTTQMMPYLALLEGDEDLQDLLLAVLRRQFRQIAHNPYANAFNAEASGRAHDTDDLCEDPWVWEEKYEVDSLAFPLLLAHRFWRATGRTDHLAQALEAARAAISVWRTEQDHEHLSKYRFVRANVPPTDTLRNEGRGTPVAETGMTWSGFRPSDDACTYGYNVPANLCAAAALDGVANMARQVQDTELADDAAELAVELRAATRQHGTVDHPDHGSIYAYEVDGLGNALLADDANMPSLLSLPLVADISPKDPLYLATRAFVLSPANPTWYRGTAAEGVGSPHTPDGYIWPIALAVEGLTSNDPERRLQLLHTLINTDAGTGAMHESFHKDDPDRFTRDWFSWANAMYAELALDLVGFGTRALWDASVGTSLDASA
ncbi:glycoside hydrolase family 125 protein [Streptomyces sp. NBC_01016]|uniref:glycoside hydrolase family 125 protein n=1 Tax=Streptomyces sp. NBC_01016 TaxID=2903720 RepID=UPI00225437D8|nr:glycoside hydrolase family 125 protein [Streptomyces sp. NBC_01016]MCX4834967.1 glycoside hydrolase family 125 protein [Streptomyces sp. NBC_01016]